MIRLIAVADEVDRRLTAKKLHEVGANLVISCGDLPPDYLNFVTSAANAPLLYVPGNHDPDQRRAKPWLGGSSDTPLRPPGTDLDGVMMTEHGLRFAGLGGSVRYRPGPNQHTQSEMRRKVRALVRKARPFRIGKPQPIDVFVAHAPPFGTGDADNPAHRGFEAFHRIIEVLTPTLMLHGHIHPHGFPQPDREIGMTTIINVIPHRILELP